MVNGAVLDGFVRYSFLAVWSVQPGEDERVGWVADLGAAIGGGFAAFRAEVVEKLSGLFVAQQYIDRNRTDEQFVEDLYLVYFLRAADAGGAGFWLNQTQQNGRAAVIAGFPESGNELNVRLAQQFDLGAPGSSGGGDFEMLLDLGSFGLKEEIDFRVIEFPFGDGYEDSALVGSTEGTRSWTLTYKILPGYIGEAEGGVFSGQSRADYLWDFFCRHMAAGNKTFRMVGPRDGRMYLAAFAETKLSYELFMTKLFSTGVSLKQRREPGVVLS